MTCIVISHDSTWAVTSSLDGTIIVWDMAGGVVLHEWVAAQQDSFVKALALSPDSRCLVSAGGNALGVWGIDSDVVLKAAELEGHTREVYACTWSPDGMLIASASHDRTMRIWDGHSYKQRGLVPVHPHVQFQTAAFLQFSPDSSYIAWISEYTDCWIWRPLMGEQPKRLPLHPDGHNIYTMAFSFDPKSHRIATAHGNENNDPDACVVRIWDTTTGTPIAVLVGPSKSIRSVSFSPDGRSLLSVADDMSMWTWDCGIWSGKQMGGFRASESPVEHRHLCVRPDGKYVATGSDKGLVRLWSTSDGECVATYDEHDSRVYCIVFSPNGQFLVSGDIKGLVHIRCISQFVGE